MGNDSRSLTLAEVGFDRDLARDLKTHFGCQTVGDVLRLTRRDFARLRGFGQPIWRCVNRQLSFLGLPEIEDDSRVADAVVRLNKTGRFAPRVFRTVPPLDVDGFRNRALDLQRACRAFSAHCNAV